MHERDQRRAVLDAPIAVQDRLMTRTAGSQEILRDVRRVLVLEIPSDVLEDIDRLQTLAEGLAVREQALVIAWAHEGRIREPEVGQQMANRTRDVVAVATVLRHGLNADTVGVAAHEFAHAERELARPFLNDGARLWR